MPGTRDHAQRTRSVRKGRERGCWVYIDAETLERSGLSRDAEPPYYRASGYARSVNGCAVIVSLYREP